MSNRRLYMETTTVTSDRTAQEIQEVLRLYGADAIMTEYDGSELRAIQFRLRIGQVANGVSQTVCYKLPCRWEALDRLLRKTGRGVSNRQKHEEKAKRVAWRQILRWTEAQLALVQTGMAEANEVFMPFALSADGRTTLFEFVKEKGLPMLGYTPGETAKGDE